MIATGPDAERRLVRVLDSAKDVNGKVAELGTPRHQYAIDNARFVRQVLGAILLVPLGLLMIAGRSP